MRACRKKLFRRQHLSASASVAPEKIEVAIHQFGLSDGRKELAGGDGIESVGGNAQLTTSGGNGTGRNQHDFDAAPVKCDDLIDDSALYFLFVRLAAYHRQMNNTVGREEYLQKVLADYREPVPGAKARVEKVLRIMLTAWAASQLRQAAEKMVLELKET